MYCEQVEPIGVTARGGTGVGGLEPLLLWAFGSRPLEAFHRVLTPGRRVGAAIVAQAGVRLIVGSDPTDPTPLAEASLYDGGAR